MYDHVKAIRKFFKKPTIKRENYGTMVDMIYEENITLSFKARYLYHQTNETEANHIDGES